MIFSKLLTPTYFTIIVLISFLFKGANDFFVIFTFYLFLIIYYFFFKKENFIHINKIGIIFLFYLILQIIPLPSSILKILSPNSFDLYDQLLKNKYFAISLSLQESFIYFFIFLSGFLIMSIISKIIHNKRDLGKVMKVIMWFAVLQSIFGMIVYLFDINQILFFYEKNHYLTSVTGTFINRNNFSFYLLISFIVSTCYLELYKKYFFKNKKLDIFNFILSELFLIRLAVLIIAIGILLTKSRAGNITFFIILFSIFALDIYKHKKLTFISISVISIVLIDLFILSNILGGEKTIERLVLTSFEGERSRIEVFQLGIKEFINYPIFGYGMGGFEVLYDLKYNVGYLFYDHVHNDFIEYLGELGIVGFVIFFISFPLLIFAHIKKSSIPSELKHLSLFCFIAILIHGNLDFALHIPANIFLLFLIYGICLSDALNNKYAI